MKRLVITLVFGGGAFGAGYFLHQYVLAPRGLMPVISRGSPWITAAFVAALGVIAAQLVKTK